MDSALLTAGITYELAKHEAYTTLESVHHYIQDKCDAYDAAHPTTTVCTGNLLCSREGRRHKADCIGKNAPFNAYVRGLQ